MMRPRTPEETMRTLRFADSPFFFRKFFNNNSVIKHRGDDNGEEECNLY